MITRIIAVVSTACNLCPLFILIFIVIIICNMYVRSAPNMTTSCDMPWYTHTFRLFIHNTPLSVCRACARTVYPYTENNYIYIWEFSAEAAVTAILSMENRLRCWAVVDSSEHVTLVLFFLTPALLNLKVLSDLITETIPCMGWIKAIKIEFLWVLIPCYPMPSPFASNRVIKDQGCSSNFHYFTDVVIYGLQIFVHGHPDTFFIIPPLSYNIIHVIRSTVHVHLT